MRVYIAKVFNPLIAVTSVPISIRVQHITVGSNNVQDIYLHTYDVFMNSQTPSLSTNYTGTAASNTFYGGYHISQEGYFIFWPDRVGPLSMGTLGYYYVLDLTSAIKPANRQSNPSQYCYSGYYGDCMYFP